MFSEQHSEISNVGRVVIRGHSRSFSEYWGHWFGDRAYSFDFIAALFISRSKLTFVIDQVQHEDFNGGQIFKLDKKKEDFSLPPIDHPSKVYDALQIISFT